MSPPDAPAPPPNRRGKVLLGLVLAALGLAAYVGLYIRISLYGP